MEYINGLAREEFLQYMFGEFPFVFDNAFSRELLANIVDYGLEKHTTSKNGLYYFLMDVIPELEPKDLIPFMDKQILTDEVLSLVENGELLEQEGGLPKCVTISAGELALDTDDDYKDEESLADIVGDYLSDTYGFCHYGFEFEVLYNEFNEPSEVVVADIQWDVDNEEELDEAEPRVVRTMDELEVYLEDKGWTVHKDEEGWEIGQGSPAGEDFWFFIRHDNDVEKAVKEIQEYAYDFDVNEHVEMWVEARGNVSGVPDVATLVEDARAIQEMLDELADGVNWCEQKTIGETLAAAEQRSVTTAFNDVVDIDYTKD